MKISARRVVSLNFIFPQLPEDIKQKQTLLITSALLICYSRHICIYSGVYTFQSMEI